jgi:hypothetical protein
MKYANLPASRSTVNIIVAHDVPRRFKAKSEGGDYLDW